MKYDLLVFIGRFQPLHLGHQEVIERARSLSKQVLVLVGSSGQARSARNPFTYAEREAMIKKIYPDVLTAPLRDHTYNDSAWIMEVQQHVKNVLIPQDRWVAQGMKDFKVGLIGCNKDHTSYYLKMFPDYASESVDFVNPLNATALRNQLFTDDWPKRFEAAAVMDVLTFDWLNNFRKTDEYQKLRAQHEYLIDYKKKYGEGPFLTADALIQVGGKILLIRRGKEYGHGLLAMPGGFVHTEKETFQQGMLRELREETNIRVPVPVLKGSIKDTFLADDPNRSARARLVSQVFHIKLENDTKLPEVRGGDDADEAMWVNLAELREEDFFEDHYHIIKKMIGIN